MARRLWDWDPPHLNEKYLFLLQINIIIMNSIETYYVTKGKLQIYYIIICYRILTKCNINVTQHLDINITQRKFFLFAVA